jgi:hypothetical protein
MRTVPSGVANAEALVAARPLIATRCVGPSSTTRRTLPRAAISSSNARAATGPE